MKDQNRKKEDLIRELKLLRALLKKSDRDKQALSALIRYSPLAIICLDKDGRVIVWNPAAEHIFGWKEDEVLGRKNPIIPEEKQEESFKLQEAVRQGKAYYSRELCRQRKDGTLVYLNAASAGLRDSDGKVTALVAIFEDISERKRKDEAVRESEERFSRAFENAAVGASMVDTGGRFIKVNRRLCEMLGYSEAELLQRTFSDVTYPEDIQKGMDALVKMMRGDIEHISLEKRYIRRDGRIIHGIVSPSAVHDENGKPTHCLGLWQDITERKTAEDAVLRTNNLLNAISRAQAEFIADANPNKIFDGLLQSLLSLTNSEYGFIGEVLSAASGEPCLKTYALTNIAWNRETRDFYGKNAPAGLEFFSLKTLFGGVLTTGQPVIANNPEADPRRGGLPEGHPPLRAFLGLPFKKSERLIGMVGIANRPGGYDDELAKNLEPFLATCSNIIEALRERAARRKSEAALRDSEQRFRSLFDLATDGIMLMAPRPEGALVIVDVNRAACIMDGYDREELIGKPTSFLDVIESPEKISHIAGRLATGEPVTFEIKHRRKDGLLIPVEVSARSVRIDGKPYILGISRDITQRKQAEESLLLFTNLLNQSNDAIFVNDPATGRFLMVNDKACTNLGYERSELLTKRTLDIESIFPDQAAWDAHVNEVKSKGHLILEGMNRRSDGTLFPVEVNVTYKTLGGMDYMVAVIRDITERKAAEQALRTSEERLSRAQKMAHVGNWEENYTTHRLYWSEEVYHIYGVDPASFTPTLEAVGKAMHPDDVGPFLKAVNAALYEHKHFEMDYRLIRPDGTVRTVHTIGRVSYDQEGKPLVHSGTVQDITEQKKAGEKLRQSEEFVRSILDTVDEGFIVIDRSFRILTANKAYCSQVGRPVSDVIGRRCYEVSHKALRPCFEEGEDCAVRRVFETGEPSSAIHRHADAAGTTLHVETKAFPIKDGTGAITSVIETVNNITEKHLLEEERLKTQKLEAIGTLAGGIAHDFNNLLQGVFGFISMAKMTLDDKERSLAMLSQAEQAMHLSVNLTKQLLTFSKGGKPVKKKMALRPVIQNSVKFALSGSRADYRIMLAEDLKPVDADEGQISQVIQNIVLNADQAMPLGGTVVIGARNVHAPDSTLPRLLKEGAYVEISVQDSGVGIPPPYLQKIFDPYFTTKEKGSGLGLTTSYSIMRNHGGMINVVSRVGEGTTCFIYLPAIDAELEAEEAPAVFQPARKGKILIMDDEEVVRSIAGEMLKTMGHTVEFAEHGEAAVDKFLAARKSGSPFDIVILDLTVRGGLGGKETNKRLLAIDPGARVIVSSGYSDDAVMADHRAHGFAACLRKPYQFDEFANTLNALMK